MKLEKFLSTILCTVMLFCLIPQIAVSPVAYADDASLRISLASQILANKNISLWDHNNATSLVWYDENGKEMNKKRDYADARQNIIDTSNGINAKRSHYSDKASRPCAPGGRRALSVNMLRAMLDLEKGFGKYTVSAIAGGCHTSLESAHYKGTAFDVSSLGGSPTAAKGKQIYSYLTQKGYKVSKVNGNNSVLEGNHYHINITGWSGVENVNSDIAARIVTYNGHVYERYDYHLSWTDAEAFCEDLGGHLVSITDVEEQAVVVDMMSGCPHGFYHIGLRIPTMNTNDVWNWVTGEAFSYNNWDADGEPSKEDGEYYAAIIGIGNGAKKTVGEWIDEPNNGAASGFYSISNCGFICEYDNTGAYTPVPAKTASYDGRTYERYDYPMTWSSAEAMCVEMGGHLVSITSDGEQAAVEALLSGCPKNYYHIGATNPTPAQTGAWGWVSGEAFGYSHWDLQAPEPSHGDNEFYAAIIGIDNGDKKQVGEWIDEPDNGGNSYYAISNSGFICEYEDSEAPVISNVVVSNLTSEGYTVTCDVSDNIGVTKVLFPTWSVQNGQDDLPSSWPEGELSNGKASFRVNVSDHNGEIDCYYYTHIYAYDAVGNYSSKGNEQYGDLYVFVPPVDTEAPVISNVIISDISSTGYTVTCDVSDNVGVTKVAFPTWSEQNGQDDIASIWPEGELSNGKASFHVNVSDHNGENNCYYYTHIYAYDAAGNYSSDGVHFFVPPADVEQPAITDVAVTDVSSAGYLVTCNVSDNVGVTKVQFPTWTDADGQDDIIWHDATISNGIASCYIKTQDHQHQFGLYITHLYAWDADGNATCGGVGVDVPNPVSNVRVENITTSEFTVKCNIDPNWGAITIGLATWTMENNQDDMIWHHGAVADGVVTDTINIIDHNNENNCIYHTHIYAWDADDNGYFVGGIDTFVPKEIYPVTYNGNASDVSNVPAPQEKYYGVDLALSNTVPVRDGYDFLGWAASPDATAAEYQPGDYYSADANLTLYAVWVSIRNLPVAFLDYGGGGEGSITLSGWAFDRDDIDVSIPIHVYIGGPSAGPEVFVYKIIADKPRPDVDAVYGVGLYHGFIETIPVKQRGTQQVYVYAIDAAGEWQDNPLIANIPVTISAPEYEVIYITPNGSTALDSQIKNEGVDLILSTEEPTYAGHHFLGWSTNPDATMAQYQPGDTYTKDADLILYAVWEQLLPDFVLPASLTTIEEEAFYGGAFTYAQVPAQVTHIGSNAFADCSKLRNIDILGMNTTIDQNAFSGVDQNALTIHGLAGSSAESFATEYGFHFAVID